MRVLALASYDSFLNIARLLAPHFESQGCTVEIALVKARVKTQISSQQISRFGLAGKVRWVSVETLCETGEITSFDIVLCCLEGASTRRLLHHVVQLGRDRPLLISVYPGLVLRHQFDGYSMRTGSDLIWLNCEADMEAFLRMCAAFGVNPDGARVFGIPSLLQTVARDPAAVDGPIVFFEQAVIPRYHDERLFLAEQLLKLARTNRGYEFLIKARTAGADATLHQTWHHLDQLLTASADENGGWPENLKLSHESATQLLSRASHCLTISSTVAVEAINAGVPTLIIGDFGAHEDYGLHYFFESGLIRRFEDIEFPFRDLPDEGWRARYMADPEKNVFSLVAEAVSLARKPRQPMVERPPAAEMSPDLRQFLTKLNGIHAVLSRSHQSRQKTKFWPSKMLSVFRKLLRH